MNTIQNTIKVLVQENPLQQTFGRTAAAPWLGLIAAGVIIGCAQPFNAFAVSDADATTAYTSFNSTFLNSSGNGYNASISSSSYDYFWAQAEDIELVEDRYENTQSSTEKDLINTLCNEFLSKYSESWIATDEWNDDLGRTAGMLARAYVMTGTANFLTQAKYCFDTAYDRGWSTQFNGGGIFEEMGVSDPEKQSLSTLSCGYAAAVIATVDSGYQAHAVDIYAWARANLFNPSTGQVYTGVYTNGTVDTTPGVNLNGMMIDYARLLYKITGTSGYFNDATAAVVYTKASLSDSDGFIDSCAAQFSRGMGHFVVDNNLWNTTFSSGTSYYTWMYNNCNTGWGNRRTDYDVTWNVIDEQTPINDTDEPLDYEGVPSLLQYTFMPH